MVLGVLMVVLGGGPWSWSFGVPAFLVDLGRGPCCWILVVVLGLWLWFLVGLGLGGTCSVLLVVVLGLRLWFLVALRLGSWGLWLWFLVVLGGSWSWFLGLWFGGTCSWFLVGSLMWGAKRAALPPGRGQWLVYLI